MAAVATQFEMDLENQPFARKPEAENQLRILLADRG